MGEDKDLKVPGNEKFGFETYVHALCRAKPGLDLRESKDWLEGIDMATHPEYGFYKPD